jgi:hypothetical protein
LVYGSIQGLLSDMSHHSLSLMLRYSPLLFNLTSKSRKI